MQQDRLDGWMVRQIENADMAKETVIQLPTAASTSKREFKSATRQSTTTSSKKKFPRLSVTAAAGQEMCSTQPPRVASCPSNMTQQGPDVDGSVEKRWRAQFADRRQPRAESDHIDRTKVIRNVDHQTHQGAEEQSPLFLWGLPRESVLDFIRQSILPSSWNMNLKNRVSSNWEATPKEEEKDEGERVRRAVANVLALASPAKSPSSPRSPTSPKNPFKTSETSLSPRRPEVLSPRASRAIVENVVSPVLSNPVSPRSSPRSDDRIHKLIADLRADPVLWAAFQRDVGRIQHQHRFHNTSDKIRENKERARTPRTEAEYNHRKKQAEERMERARCKREQIIHVEDLSKREAYLRHMHPGKQLTAAEVELTVRYRRRKMWLLVMSFAAISSRWHTNLIQIKHVALMAKLERRAACTIQRLWRRWRWRHASKNTVVVYTWLRKCLWKLILKVRCRRKARQAALLRKFILDNSTESNATRNFMRVMLHWRHNVVRAQKAGRSFVNCTRARLQTLSLVWDAVDHDRQRLDRDEGRRSSIAARKDSFDAIASRGGSASGRRKSIYRGESNRLMGGVDEKLAAMQMLLTPVEIQRIQHSVQVVKIPKSIKQRLLLQFLTEVRKKFMLKLQNYKDQIRTARYAREVKLDEARAIVQNSVSRTTSPTRSGSSSRAANSPPCFFLFSDPNTIKAMEELVRRGVQLTLEVDPELRALVARQLEHRKQPQLPSPHRSSVSFSVAAASSVVIQPASPPTPSPPNAPSPRNSILKRDSTPIRQ